MSLNSENQAYLYKEYWIKIEQFFTTNVFTEFLRHYLIMKTHNLVKRNKVYDTYKNYFHTHNLDSEAALADLYKFARFYNEMLNCNTESSEFNKILRHVNVMESKVIYPYFLMLLEMRQNSEIDWDKLIELAHIMESYLFRLKVCRHATNGVNRIVIALCDKDKAKSDLQKNEIYKLNNSFPDDSDLKNSLLEVNLYKQRNNLAKLALVVLEENRTRETINFDNAQVEHIMPQRLNNDWRLEVKNADKINEQLGGTIGNLTLTMYNQEMSNKIFSDKKEYYSKSNVSLTREIPERYDQWNKDTILDRTKDLSNELCQIFAKPDIKSEEAEDIADKMSIFDDESYSDYLETDEFKELMSEDTLKKFSKEELQVKADAALGKLVKKNKVFSFSASENKDKKVNKIGINASFEKTDDNEPYGDYFKSLSERY